MSDLRTRLRNEDIFRHLLWAVIDRVEGSWTPGSNRPEASWTLIASQIRRVPHLGIGASGEIALKLARCFCRKLDVSYGPLPKYAPTASGTEPMYVPPVFRG
jgi:hypothetical protein